MLVQLGFPPPETSLPENGVYFIFEDGEHAHGSERIVRVGSHTGPGNLAARLREHLTENKDRSVFRKHIGRAILTRANDPFVEQWELDLTTREKRDRFGGGVDKQKQVSIEHAVSRYIQTKMSVSVIPIPDNEAALHFERLCIGTLSRCSECVPSAEWLGSFSPLEKIRQSGLWQVQGLSGGGLSGGDLTTLARLAGEVSARGQTLNDPTNYLYLTDRFTRAVDYARHLHIERRKGTGIPYIAHLIGVSSLVMGEAGHVPIPVTEDMVIAALLHDAAEDHGGLMRLRDIEHNFGPDVARMVEGLTDSFSEQGAPKAEWETRKKAYLQRLQGEPDDVHLISAADKLYNARAILDDYRDVGPRIWERFKRGRDQQLWHFHEILGIFSARARNRLVDELTRVVRELEAISSGEAN